MGLTEKKKAGKVESKEAAKVLFLKKQEYTPTNPGLFKPSHMECTNMVVKLLTNFLKISHHQVP